jgi:hypothetical protein
MYEYITWRRNPEDAYRVRCFFFCNAGSLMPVFTSLFRMSEKAFEVAAMLYVVVFLLQRTGN